MRSVCLRFLRSDDAATAVEYAVLLALIMLTCIVAIRAFGVGSGSLWGTSHTRLEEHGFGSP